MRSITKKVRSFFFTYTMAPTSLEIKTKALKRLVKERSLYQQEVDGQKKLVDQMKQNGADEYETKKQIEVLHESERMLPELEKKITIYKKELGQFLDSYQGNEDTTEARGLLD